MERALRQINISIAGKERRETSRHYSVDSKSKEEARITLREMEHRFGFRPKYESRIP